MTFRSDLIEVRRYFRLYGDSETMNTITVYFASRMFFIITLLSAALPGFTQSPAPDSCSRSSIPATTPSSEFTVLGDGSSIRHESTGLVWQRCLFGQIWDDNGCMGSATGHNLQEALDIAANAGSNWRLPNIKELQSIVERCRERPAINRQAFPGTGLRVPDTISSSPSQTPGDVWGVVFDENGRNRDSVTGGFVRLVRGGQ